MYYKIRKKNIFYTKNENIKILKMKIFVFLKKNTSQRFVFLLKKSIILFHLFYFPHIKIISNFSYFFYNKTFIFKKK